MPSSDWDLERVSLPAGRYLVKVYLDRERLLDRDPAAFLGKRSFYGQTVVEAEWKRGFRDALWIPGAEFGSEATQ